MKKHLRILYGCDDRYELTINTIKVCRSYFDSIGVLNAGLLEFKDRLQQGIGPDVTVTQFKQFFEIESARRSQIRDIPWDDWVMWLDADETPSPSLLENLDRITTHCEENNYDLVKFYWSEHTDGIHHPPSRIPQNMEEFCSWNSVFAPNRYIKKKRGIKASSCFGAHELFQNVGERWVYQPYAVHHHKSFLQYHQSVTFSGFMNPTVHVNCNIALKDIIDTPEYKALKAFQRKYQVFTSNDLVRKIKVERDMVFRQELMDLFLSFPDGASSDLGKYRDDVVTTFKFMHIFAEKHNLDVNSPHFPCGKQCCKYGDIQL